MILPISAVTTVTGTNYAGSLHYTTKQTTNFILALKLTACIQLFMKSDTLGKTVTDLNYVDYLFKMFSTKIPRFLSNIIFYLRNNSLSC